VFVDKDALGGSQESEAHFGPTRRRLTFRKLIKKPFLYLVRILADGHQPILDPVELVLDAFQIHIGANRADFFRILFPFRWTPPYDRGYAFDFFIPSQPVCDVHHDIPGTDDCDVLAHFERAITKAGEPVEMVDDVFGVEDALRRIPFYADGFSPLCAD
jgi:hypothetical protein